MKVNFNKTPDNLIPAIIQDNETKNVLMLGYMNQEALDQTLATKRVTFFSRTKNRLWTKGEESGNFLELISMKEDCDNDTLLVKVKPVGPTCHTGLDTCWQEANNQEFGFLSKLEKTIATRKANADSEKSYVASLFAKGMNKIAQKVGEEGVETVIAALAETETDLINEASDLVFHLLVLLKEKNLSLEVIAKNLESRHQ